MDRGGGTTTLSALPLHIVYSHILTALDARSLASFSSVSRIWRTVCSQESLWKPMCFSLWPSLAGGGETPDFDYRSLYSDCATTSCSDLKPRRRRKEPEGGGGTRKLISTVDIYCDDQALFSRHFETDTLSDEFLRSPFKITLLGPKVNLATPLKLDEVEENCAELAESRLRVSWILLDPVTKRAINIAGSKAVEVGHIWNDGVIELRCATVVPSPGGKLAQCSVVLTCGCLQGELQVVEASLQVEDVDGKAVAGKESLGIIGEAMEGRRCLCDGKIERERYKKFMIRRFERKEREEVLKQNMDVVIITAGVSILAAIWSFLPAWTAQY